MGLLSLLGLLSPFVGFALFVPSWWEARGGVIPIVSVPLRVLRASV